MIDYSKLSGDSPNFQYDTAWLKSQGYKFRAAYDFENPDLEEELSMIQKSNIPYKVLNGEDRQKDVWVKDGG